MKRYSQWTNNNKIDEAIISSKNDKLIVEIPDNFFELSDIIEERVAQAEEEGSNVLDLSSIEVKNVRNFARKRDDKIYTIFEPLRENKHTNIEILNVSHWNLKSLKNLDNVFFGLKNIKEIIGLDTWKVPTTIKSADYTFANCNKLRELKMFSTTFIESFIGTFGSCWDLREIPEMDLSNCVTAAKMFRCCYHIKVCPEFNLKKCEIFRCMFEDCSRLKKVPAFEIDYLKYIDEMFKNCESLYSIPFFKIKEVSSDLRIYDVFEGCDNLTPLDPSDSRINNYKSFGAYWLENSLVKNKEK